MPFYDLRAYLKKLEEEGELHHIGEEVDWDEEVGAILRRTSELRMQGIMFDNVKDYPGWRIAGETMSTIRQVAIAMDLPSDTPPAALIAEFLGRTATPIKPRLVKTGPCKENILLGDQMNLLALPAPLLHTGDGGRYLCTWHITILKDPDSDWVNWATYRGMVHDRDKLGLLVLPDHHIGTMVRKMESRNQPLEVAIAIGVEPMSVMAAQTFFPAGVSEVDMAGAMRGEPVELAQCETVDLQVPATSEIVIEGKMIPGERLDEGPFGEYTGFRAADRSKRPFMHVTAITYRNAPILTASCTGLPTGNDCHIPMAITRSAEVLQHLQNRGFPVTGVWFFPETSCDIAAVATKVPYANIASAIAHSVFGMAAGHVLPFLVVVPDEVDPYSWAHVMHAIATRCHPYRGIRRSEFETTNPLDPRLPLHERQFSLGSKAIFDTSRKPLFGRWGLNRNSSSSSTAGNSKNRVLGVDARRWTVADNPASEGSNLSYPRYGSMRSPADDDKAARKTWARLIQQIYEVDPYIITFSLDFAHGKCLGELFRKVVKIVGQGKITRVDF